MHVSLLLTVLIALVVVLPGVDSVYCPSCPPVHFQQDINAEGGFSISKRLSIGQASFSVGNGGTIEAKGRFSFENSSGINLPRISTADMGKCAETEAYAVGFNVEENRLVVCDGAKWRVVDGSPGITSDEKPVKLISTAAEATIASTSKDSNAKVTISAESDAAARSRIIDLQASGSTAVDSVSIGSNNGGIRVDASSGTPDAKITLAATGDGSGLPSIVHLTADGSTSDQSIDINSAVGGISLSAMGVNTGSRMKLAAKTTAAMNEEIYIVGEGSGMSDAVSIKSLNGGITLSAPQATNGQVLVTSAGSSSNSAVLESTGTGPSSAAVVRNTGGTGQGSVRISSTSGGIQVHAGDGTGADSMIDLVGNVASAAINAIRVESQGSIDDNSLFLKSANGGVTVDSATKFIVSSKANAFEEVSITSSGGTASSMVMRNEQGESLNSIHLHSQQGGIKLESPGSALGKVMITAGAQTSDAVVIEANGGANSMIDIRNTGGVNSNSVTLSSTNGGISLEALGSTSNSQISLVGKGPLTSSLPTLNLEAQGSNRVDSVFMHSVDGGVTISTMDSANGKIDIESKLNGVGSISLTENGGSDGQLHLNSMQSARSDSVYVSSAAGGISLISGTGGPKDFSNLLVKGRALSTVGPALELVAEGHGGDDSMVIESLNGGVLAQSFGAMRMFSAGSGDTSIVLQTIGGTGNKIQLLNDHGNGFEAVRVFANIGGVYVKGKLPVKVESLDSSNTAVHLKAATGQITLEANSIRSLGLLEFHNPSRWMNTGGDCSSGPGTMYLSSYGPPTLCICDNIGTPRCQAF